MLCLMIVVCVVRNVEWNCLFLLSLLNRLCCLMNVDGLLFDVVVVSVVVWMLGGILFVFRLLCLMSV